MNSIIRNKKRYYDFFKWHNHYTFHDTTDSPETDGICDLCAKLNNYTFRNDISVHSNFSAWWNETKVNDNERNLLSSDLLEEDNNISAVKFVPKASIAKGQFIYNVLKTIDDFFFGPSETL